MPHTDNTEQQQSKGDVWCQQQWVGRGLRSEICTGCIARQQHSNCWEVTVSPCCKRSRTECKRCEVYISYQRTCGASQEAEIHLADGTVLVGNIYVPPDRRFSELVNDPQRLFLTITDIAEDPQHTANSVASSLLLLNKRTIKSIQPLERNGAAARIDGHSPKRLHQPPTQQVA